MFLGFLFLLIVEILGATIVRGMTRAKMGEAEALEAEGFFYLGIGLVIYFMIEDLFFSGYLSSDERVMLDIVEYCGIIDMVVGGVLILKGIFKSVASNNNTTATTATNPQPIQSTPYMSSGWKCKCGHSNPEDDKFCGACGGKKPEPTPAKWICECGHENPIANKFCGACGKKVVQAPKEQIAESSALLTNGHIVENDVWICGECGKRNLLTRPTCWFCDCSRDR